MNKIIAKCGVCGIKVATTKEDSDPICADCLEWANEIELRGFALHLCEKLENKLMEALNMCIDLDSASLCSQLSNKERNTFARMGDMGLVLHRGMEYLRELRG